MEQGHLPSQHADVLIVGGGPVGMVLALELGRRGLSCMIVEERTRPSIHARAKQTNTRTMEHFRRLGIADDMRRAAPLGGPEYYNIYFMTQLLGGHVINHFENVWGRLPSSSDGSPPEMYAEPVLHIPQPIVEEVLRRHVQKLTQVELRLGWRLVAFQQDEQGVTAEIVATDGQHETVTAAYIAGCDGSQSTVRRLLGIQLEVEGSATATRMISAVYSAPTLRSQLRTGPALQYWVVKSGAYLGPLNATDRWWLLAPSPAADGSATKEDALQLFLRSCGMEIPCEVIDAQPWTGRGRLATHYSAQRAFLLGDAAHLHPPTGGYGMNMGIGDAVDLGWKLAAVLQGWGGEHLLASYEIERRPVHRFIIQAALANFALLPGKFLQDGIDADTDEATQLRHELSKVIAQTKSQEFYSLGAQLGSSHYELSPLIIPDGVTPPPVEITRFEPLAFAGGRAPHIWLTPGESLYDTFGPDFTLMQLGPQPPDTTIIEQAARAQHMPLKIIRHKDPRLYELYKAALVLIRPDQHIAWRAHMPPTDPASIIAHVRGAYDKGK